MTEFTYPSGSYKKRKPVEWLKGRWK